MGHAQRKLPEALAPLGAPLNGDGHQMSLTVALPTGAAGKVLRDLITGLEAPSLGPMSFVPAWSSASLKITPTRRGWGFEEIELFQDEWAAVAGADWRGGCDLTARDLANLPLVAVTPAEHEAWQLLLQGHRPQRLRRTSRADSQSQIATGAALGIANVPLLGLYNGLTPVSRCHTWPGTGLWASVQGNAPARDRGWALAVALRQAFRGRGARPAN